MSDFASLLARRTDPENAAVWDPVGLQVGDPDRTVASVAVCHEVTEAVTAAVEESPVDLLVTYHPLLFTPVNRLLAGRSPAARAFRLIEAGVNLLVTHTDFDSARGGTADALADAVGLGDVEPFGEDEIERIPAIGRVGRFEGDLGDLSMVVAEELGSRGVRVSGDSRSTIDRVAVIPGSGSDLLDEAASLADAVVTGDVSHHRVVRALDLGMSVVDPGHIATERPGIKLLVELVAELSGMTPVDLTDFDPQTWS